jgi:hypothetical protein
MPKPRRSPRLDQQSLFQPAPKRPRWRAFPAETREVAVRLLTQLFRDYVKRRQLDRGDVETDDE